MEIKRAVELGDSIREKLCELYIEAFYNDGLKNFSKDKAKLVKAFTHVFELEYFYVAVIDGEIAGMIACMGRGPFCMKFKKKIFIKHLGIFWGLLAYFIYKSSAKDSLKLGENTALIEYVATNAKYRRKGVASTLMKHLFTFSEYKHYVLKVADTNPDAFELYKKLGYKEKYRKKFMPNSGINYWIHMEYSKE